MNLSNMEPRLLSGDEAIALAALHASVALGVGYPGTPSTEILEVFSTLGGKAQWAPNEKVAMEVGLGAAYAGARTLVTMKHVGVNVAADPLFTAAYTGVSGALVLVSADDPGLASSQNEQDNRRFAVAAAVPMLEPSDSQEAYDFLLAGLEISHHWQIPVLLRITTRVCHSKTIVTPRPFCGPSQTPKFERDVKTRVMIPAYAKLAHRRLRQKLHEMEAFNNGQAAANGDGAWKLSDNVQLNSVRPGSSKLGIIASGISFFHACEAAPEANILKLGMTHPLPMERISQFVARHQRVVVIEEGDPYLVEAIRAQGIPVEAKSERFRFGELNVDRVRRILNLDESEEPQPPRGKPPQLCLGCPHRLVFETLRDLGCIVSGDIGCYTLGVLPPFDAMDTCVCMGASIGVALGMRHVLPAEQASKVVSVIGDSTFVHSGITGLVEMIYNPPATGHVAIILDNGTTAMTGLQEHPGTGRTLSHEPTNKIIFEDLARSLGLERVFVEDPLKDRKAFEQLVSDSLAGNELTLIIVRRPCLLAAKRINELSIQVKQAGKV